MMYDYTNKNIIVSSNEYLEDTDTDIIGWIRKGELLLKSLGLPSIINRCVIEDHELNQKTAGYTTYQLYT